MRVVPSSTNKESSVNTTKFGQPAEHAPALQDSLRSQEGPLNIASKINNRHPLESQVTNWEKTQEENRMETYRRIFGAGAPIKRAMELEIVESSSFRPSLLGGVDSMHKDILLNKDSCVDWEDVYPGGFANGDNVKDFHSEMEKQMGI